MRPVHLTLATGTSSAIARVCLALAMASLTASCTPYRRAYAPADRQPAPKTQRTPSSQRPYTVNGTRYEPLSSHQGFEQVGLASSYGREFHGRTTSSGERFDMNALTAAHKTLPLGVYVRVQHKQNGKDVIVRVNDRGPFVGNRVIDLSEAAAERLDMLREGLAPVRITALGYKGEVADSHSGYRQPADYDRGTFSLQVGAFTVRANAYRYAEGLRGRFGSADVQETLIKGTTYYRVRAGRYTSLRAAQVGQEQHERSGFPGCFVVAVD